VFANPDSNVIDPDSCGQVPEVSLWERLGRVSMMDIESSNFSWSSLTSLHHTKHTATSIDTSEDDINRSFEVCICSIHFLCKLLSFTIGETLATKGVCHLWIHALIKFTNHASSSF